MAQKAKTKGLHRIRNCGVKVSYSREFDPLPGDVPVIKGNVYALGRGIDAEFICKGVTKYGPSFRLPVRGRK